MYNCKKKNYDIKLQALCSQSWTTDTLCRLFSLKSQTFGLGQTNWADKSWGIWRVLGQTFRTRFETVHVFHYSTIISTKLSLYIHIPNIYLEMGFEFEPQSIRDLAFMYPQSVYSILIMSYKVIFLLISGNQCM